MKRNLFVAALTLCCSVLMFSAQPAMAASYNYTYEYPYELDIPNPLDVAAQVPEVAAYLETNGADALNYVLFDYGDSYIESNQTHETYTELTDTYAGYRFYNWYYLYSEDSGSAIKPQNRYLYVFYPDELYSNGASLTGSAKVEYNSNASTSVKSPGLSLRIMGSPICAVWYDPDTHNISIDKNTFGSYDIRDTDTYLVCFARNANSTVKLYDNVEYKYADNLYPCLVGMKDTSFDVSTLSLGHVMFYYNNYWRVASYSVPNSVVSDLSQYTFTFEFGNDMNSILLNVGNMISGIFGFMSDVVILLSENTVILILLCIPLVGLAISLFKSFTSR